MEESSYCSGKNYSSSKSKNNEGLTLRKGPWKPEEDQVLVNHVNKYGPRDWSSIRSKGLLQRTGKSCRLRWVNKLRPNLKNGCKFTAEEERVVIELQAQLGNKWATIATHLVGRTDNDVKNFWSSRQKRLARLLHSQSPQPPPLKRLKSSSSSAISSRNRPLFVEVPKTPFIDVEATSKPQSSSASSYIDTNTTNSDHPLSDPTKDIILDATPLHEMPCSNEALQQLDDEMTAFPTIPTLLRFPPETQELIDRLDSSFLQTFDEPLFTDDGGLQGTSCCGCQTDNAVTLDSFFDDFPADMFDIEPLPSPSSW
ncbi:hypothetical protein RND81_03G195800 [Saponaria officinalis]|uniref:Uncharacterized protein n=1 Tax=Saponaria officinalis TaxID=3572 RepID=A0AAW1M7J5_SAPOF